MEQIMKVYLAVFLLLLLLFSAGGIFGLYLEVADAQDFTANVINEMECSDFDAGIIQEAYTRAEELGYTLDMELYETNGSSQVPGGAGAVGNTKDVYLARIEVTYPLELGLFDLKRQQTVCGYAR